jgi:pilus assembly protein FimV
MKHPVCATFASPTMSTLPAASTTLGPVAAGDTLWSLAAAHRPARDISVPQMMNALMRANPELFPSADPGQLAEGTTLRLPTPAEIGAAAP